MPRHTFATTFARSNGVPIKTVSKLMGRTKIASTQIYARVLENKVSQDMNALRQYSHSLQISIYALKVRNGQQ